MKEQIIDLKRNVFEYIDDRTTIGQKLIFKSCLSDLSDFSSDSVDSFLKIISVIPNLNNKLCEKQTQEFNINLLKLPNIRLFTISMDLPFASNRLCYTERDAKHLIMSDYRYKDFANKTGLIFNDWQFLCRSVLILNQNNEIIYKKIANPVNAEINYQKIYNFVKKYNEENKRK